MPPDVEDDADAPPAQPAAADKPRVTWRTDLVRIGGALLLVALLLGLAWVGKDALKYLGPPQRCWEYREIEGKLYKVNPCTGQFQLVGDVPAQKPEE